MEKIIIDVDASSAEKTIKDIRAELSEAKRAFESAAIGSDEFKEATERVAEVQQELKQAINTSTLSTEEARKTVDTTDKSYNDLVATMAELKKAWRATTDETARAEIGENINAVNDRLKELDASTGNYQRNVGNYAGSLEGLFSNLGGQIKDTVKTSSSAGTAVSGVFGVLKSGLASLGTALKANPIMTFAVIIGAVVSAFKSLIEKIGVSEGAANALKVAMAPVEAVFNAVGIVIDEVATKLAAAAEAVFNFIEKIGLMPDSVKEAAAASKELSESSIELRRANEALSVVEAEMAEKRAIAADRTLTATERQQALTEAHNAELEALKKVAEQLAKNLAAMEKQASLSPTTAEGEKELAQARIANANAQRAVSEEVKAYNKQVAEINNAVLAEEKARREAVVKAMQAQAAEAKAQLARDKEIAQLQVANAKEYSAAYMEASQKVIEMNRAEALSKAEAYKNQEQQAEYILLVNEKFNQQQQALIAARDEYNAKIAESAAALQAEADAAIDALNSDELAETFESLKESIFSDEEGEPISFWGVFMNPDEAMATIEANQENLSALQQQVSDFYQQKGETDDQAAARYKALQTATAQAAIKVQQDEKAKRVAIASQMATGIAGTLNTVTQALEMMAEENESARNVYKGVAYANTVVNTAEGAMGAYQAMASIPYVGPALGAAAAAAVVAAGAVQLKQISNSGSSSGSSSSLSESSSTSSTTTSSSTASVVPELTSTITEVTEASAASTETTTQTPQRVYIVQSDIYEANQNYAEIVNN